MLTAGFPQWERRGSEQADSMRELMYSETDTRAWYDLYVPSLDDRKQGLSSSSSERSDPLLTMPPACRLCDPARISAASWLPALWGMYPTRPGRAPQSLADDTTRAMRHSGLVSPSDLLSTTLQRSGQQWDAPNCWPPLLCTWVDGLLAWGTQESCALAHRLSRGYLRAVQRGLHDTGCVWEKYDADGGGASGSGGEYPAQVGFGWSNGVALHLMVTHGMTL